MEFLGIGPLELFFIIIIALIILGPKDMVKAGRTLGKYVRQIITSENWRMIQQATQEMRNLPNRFIRDAGLENIEQELSQATGNITKGISQAASDLGKGLTVSASLPKDPGANPSATPPKADNPEFSDWTNPPMSNSDINNWTTPPEDSSDLSDWITPPSYSSKTQIKVDDAKPAGQSSTESEKN
jgi:sec-independent protein translocase protein TatB